MSLAGKTLFITGASRGIGLAIALRAAARRRQRRDRRQDRRAASQARRHDLHRRRGDREGRRPGAAARLSTCATKEQVKAAIEQTAATFGGIDIVVNNASAIQLTPVAQTDMNRFDLMHQINARGTFMVSKYALPHLEKAGQPAHPDAVAAARHEGEMVRAAHRLFDGEVRHEPGRAGTGRRTARQGSRSTRCGRAPPSPPRRSRTCSAATPSMRMSRKPEILADAAYRIFHKPVELHRPLPDRRQLSSRRKASPTSTNTASIRASRCRSISSCPTICRRRPGVSLKAKTS